MGKWRSMNLHIINFSFAKEIAVSLSNAISKGREVAVLATSLATEEFNYFLGITAHCFNWLAL